jgi:hypothetical protein
MSTTVNLSHACRTHDHDLCTDYGCGCDCHAAELHCRAETNEQAGGQA